MTQLKNIIIIGAGSHSKRIYFPLAKILGTDLGFAIKAIVDIESQQKSIEEYCSVNEIQALRYYVPEAQKTYDHLHPEVLRSLNEIVSREKIDAVIIASEPLTHNMYLQWSIDKCLPALMDKPISTELNVSTSPAKALKLIKDYNNYLDQYISLKKTNPGYFISLMAQRRYHNSFNLIREFLRDCFDQTNCPVTAINTFHTDGQWRTPHEIQNQLYHSYNQGYGKCSHSGYHYFDIIPYFLSSAVSDEKNYDTLETFANFVRPNDFIAQLTIKDHEKVLGEDFKALNNYSQKDLEQSMHNFGEVDAYCSLALKKKGRTITNISLNLAHNGVSSRNWGQVGDRCLYKGIGRIGHETHIIEQGPFQAIHFHSYKSKSNDLGEYDYGGENHLEVIVYRNNSILGGKHIYKFNLKDFQQWETNHEGIKSVAKASCLKEFISKLHSNKNPLNSDFSTHVEATQIISSIYLSAANSFVGADPIVKTAYSQKEHPLYSKRNISKK